MRRPEPGFTLLESIVALAILSVGLMAAFAWFDRDVDALRRMDRVALESVVLDVALARLKRIDLASERDGTFNGADIRSTGKRRYSTNGRAARCAVRATISITSSIP